MAFFKILSFLKKKKKNFSVNTTIILYCSVLFLFPHSSLFDLMLFLVLGSIPLTSCSCHNQLPGTQLLKISPSQIFDLSSCKMKGYAENFYAEIFEMCSFLCSFLVCHYESHLMCLICATLTRSQASLDYVFGILLFQT